MFSLYGGVKIVHGPQRKEYELLETIRGYDGLCWGLITAYTFILI